jgi:hypothetical protein
MVIIIQPIACGCRCDYIPSDTSKAGTLVVSLAEEKAKREVPPQVAEIIGAPAGLEPATRRL